MTHAESVATSPFLDMRPRDQTRLAAAFLRCSTCSGVAANAAETSCCRVLLCGECARDRRCPACQSSCRPRPSHLARRLVESHPWGSGAESQLDQAERRSSCPKLRECPECGCKFSASSLTEEEEMFLDHVMSEHGEKLAHSVQWMFEDLRRRNSLLSSKPGDCGSSDDRGDRARLRMAKRDPSLTFVQHTGKNYCRGPLNGPPCHCCDSACGPFNGCNCVDCMRKDLVTFGINAPSDRALVNREGAVARVSAQTGKFYCGRPNMRHDRTTDGYCGPNNGNNCSACRLLDRQACDRYASIVINWGDQNEPYDTSS